MKHIKEYKLFENIEYFDETINEMMEDVKDICLELEDEGYSIDIYPEYWPSKEIRRYNLLIEKLDKRPLATRDSSRFLEFNYSEVEEVVNRIVRYLGENIIETAVYIGETIHPDDGAWVGLDKFESSGFMTTGVKIIFKPI